MDRRTFCSLSAGLLAGAPLVNAEAASAVHDSAAAAPAQAAAGQPERLRFTRERTAAGPFERAGAGPQPHLILISADMVSPDLYRPDRPFAQKMKIPAIRSLMADGCFFANAFCTVPLCAPSRGSYMTGRYSTILGNGEHAPEGLDTTLHNDDVVFPEYLKASGYVTRQVGKCHVGAQKFLDAFGENDQPWERWSPPVYDDDGYMDYLRRLGVKPQKYAREIVFEQQDRKTPANSVGGWVVQQDGKPFPLDAQYSYYLGERVLQTIDDLMERGNLHHHPLYLQVDLFDPHQPFAIPAGMEERERELRSQMSLPASYRSAQQRNFKRADDEPEIIDLYRRYWGIYDDEKLIDYRVAYALQMEVVDHVIGRILAKLKQVGLYEDALIAFISDHGEMNGRRALVDKGVYLHPDVLRVPFVVKPAGRQPLAKHVENAPVSLLDLSQTMLEAAGIHAEARFDGLSLLPILRGEHAVEERTLLFFGGWHVGVNFACGIQHRYADGRHFLYSFNCSSTVDELFDLGSEDAVNLVGNAEFATVRRQMIERLGRALAADARWSGYWTIFRLMHFSDLPVQQGDMQKFAGLDE